MNELKRVFSFRNILLMLVLLLVNAILIISNGEETELALVYDKMVNMANSNHESTESYTDAATNAWHQYFEENNIDSSDNSERATLAKQARKKLMSEAKYIDSFKSNIEKKEQTAVAYALSGTYKENSFEYNNLLKTRYDLSSVAESDVRLSNGIWLEKLFKNRYIHLLSLVSVIFTVYLFFMERKNGLYSIVHTSAKGRGNLFLKRCVLLLAQSLLFNLIVYIESAFLLIKMYGGIEGIGDAAVSSELFLLTSGTLTRIEFLALIILVSALTTAVMALLLWAVLLCFSNVNIGMFFYLFICAVDVIIYNMVSAKSIFKAIKYINLYYLIFPNEAIEYYNWGFSDVIFSLLSTTVCLSAVLGVILLSVSAYKSIKKYFNNKENLIEHIMQSVLSLIMRLLENTNNMGKEIYKILVSQRVIFVLLILLYIGAGIQPGVGVIYDAKKSYMAGYFEKAEGLSYGPELISIYNEYKEDYEQFVDNFDYTIENAGAVLQNRTEMFNAVEQNVNYIKQLNENDVNVVVISPYAYMDTIGFKEQYNQELLALINVIAAIVISCGFISYEKKVMIHKLTLSSKNRRKWLLQKLFVQCMLSFLFLIITYVLYYVRLNKIYDYRNITAPLKSIMIFEDFIINPPIVLFVLIDFITKMLMLISVQMIINVVSIYLKYLYGYIAGAVIIIPQLLYMIGFDYMHRLSIVRYISFFPCISDSGIITNAYWIVLVSAIVFGVGSCLYIIKGETVNTKYIHVDAF
ncbi:MAG: hypothetical protein ACI4E1_11950 [Lachnospira sp.]